jgi:hypothetical protein
MLYSAECVEGFSANFASTEFSEVRRFLGALACLCPGAHTLPQARGMIETLHETGGIIPLPTNEG